MAFPVRQRYTPDEYLTLERRADHKSEYINGHIYAMAGASYAHNLIVANVVGELRGLLRSGPCRAVSSDLRVKVEATGLYTYPDVVVICGEPRFSDDDLDTLVNPTVLFEVLSPSTEAYDRGDKFAHYRRLDSLTDYVLVAQVQQRVERFTRQGDLWVFSEVSNLADILPLPAIGCDLALREVYEQVEFPGGGETVSPASTPNPPRSNGT